MIYAKASAVLFLTAVALLFSAAQSFASSSSLSSSHLFGSTATTTATRSLPFRSLTRNILYRSIQRTSESFITARRMVLDDATLDQVLAVAIDASQKAGDIIVGNAGGAEVTERKANSRDLLTLIDPLCEKMRRFVVYDWGILYPCNTFMNDCLRSATIILFMLTTLSYYPNIISILYRPSKKLSWRRFRITTFWEKKMWPLERRRVPLLWNPNWHRVGRIAGCGL